MKRLVIIIGIGLLLLLVAGAVILNWNQFRTSPAVPIVSSKQPQVTINGQTYFIEIADTPETQRQGLSGRLSLPRDHGMLFIFAEKQIRSFWMKDMHFPLDIIWIDGDTIVDISENVPSPASGEQPAVVSPKAPVDKVLEINAGETKKYSFSIGQTVSMN